MLDFNINLIIFTIKTKPVSNGQNKNVYLLIYQKRKRHTNKLLVEMISDLNFRKVKNTNSNLEKRTC